MTYVYYMFYRAIMKLAHRYDWHYAPIIGPFDDGSTQKWCKWCGFRMTIPRLHYRYNKELRIIEEVLYGTGLGKAEQEAK